MSGHSKWHNIQKTKGAADAKRAQAFTKIAREMIVAVKEGGSGDPNNNSRLAAVITKAKAANMPNDNIKRTIDKALGAGNTDNYEKIVYEGYGPSGVAIIVDAMTDNRNRTAGEIRHYFDKYGGNMGAANCVSWSFDRKGVIVIDNATKKIESNKLVEITADSAKDETVAAAAQAITDAINKEYGTVFAKNEVKLNGDKAYNKDTGLYGNRDGETNLGNLITDSMVWTVKKSGGVTVDEKHIVAVTNGGGIRAAINPGDITKKDVNTVLPFGNTIAVVYITGAELLEALEASTYCVPASTIGGFPQVSGIVYTIDGTKTYDAGDVYEGSTYHAPKTIRRVTIQSVGGKAFNLRTVYTIATNDFLAAGGDTYYAFKTASVNYDLGIPMDEVVMDYVKTELKGVVSAEDYGEAGDRITIIKGLPFTDVDPSAAYYSAVKYCYENNIFKGVTDTMFMPNNTITRGQMVTVLWRMNGSPEPKNANPFGDVAATSPFVKAIAWAAENKLTNGITETTFAPAQAISRQQFLTILYRYAQFMGYDVSVGEDTNILSFEDVGEVGEYAIPAMQWAVGSGVLAAEKTLTPRAAAPRYNVAEFLANFCMKVIPTVDTLSKAA